ncbi:cellular tumor antigen p53 [Frankliniella occidentalis]|uniref:Cellular tumor antigen p53 n=1 Tax=Frankliniella occidentalis TaxID=133901 RepID=A0A6J1SZF7_FRAOC|nr:cellular tumor antigen p53 [Frankliniella occidentalis]
MSSQESQVSEIFSQETFQELWNAVQGEVEHPCDTLEELKNEMCRDYVTVSNETRPLPLPKVEPESEVYPSCDSASTTLPPPEPEETIASTCLSSATGTLPPTDNFLGSFSFSIQVGNKSQYFKFSPTLNKIFVKPDKVIPFKVMWSIPTPIHASQTYFIRAVLVFSDANRFQEAVKRCVVHRDRDFSWNKGCEEISDHVIMSLNENSKYCLNDSSERRSVVVPLQQHEGMAYSLINYKFMCLTSCSRSDMDIIFTLENERGNVLGRSKLGVKICMVPERDHKNEERKIVPEGKSGKRKRKILAEPETTIVKKEMVNPSSSSCNFLVVAASPEEAIQTKDLLQKFNVYQEALKGRAPVKKIIENVPLPLYDPSNSDLNGV